MQQTAFYLLKVIACSGILLLYYRLALRNKRFHYYNRFYLLATVAASILLPLLNINWFTISSNNNKAIALMDVMYVQGQDATITAGSNNFFIDWHTVPLAIYGLISILFIIVLIWRVRKIYAFKKRYSATSMGEFDFINTDLSQAPFSFLQNLFWRNDIDLNETTGRQILQHELTHIRQKHTWDKLAMQLVLSILWINPFYWFIQKELYLLHEFIADEKAIENNDGAAFAAMLLTSQYGQKIFSPAQSFAYSPIKRRLYMLTNLAKPRYSYVRRLMVLPLLACVIMLFAFRLQKKQENAGGKLVLIEAKAPFKVIIDAGHGGDDAGMQFKGKAEKEITLQLAEKIKSLSPKYNIDVVLSRTGDFTFSEMNRLNIASSQNASAFICLHLDYKKSNTNNNGGVSAYVSSDNAHFAESKLLGSAVLQNLSAGFKTDKLLKERRAAITILKNNPLPAILLQCGTLDNASDFKNLTSDGKIGEMANEILEGVATYANHQTTGIDVKQEMVLGTYSPKKDTAAPVIILDGSGITINYKNDSLHTHAKPVIILDGEEVPWSAMSLIEPGEIESVHVLKDETATNAYGQKGVNGVVEIYTKKYATAGNIVQLTETPPITIVGRVDSVRLRSDDVRVQNILLSTINQTRPEKPAFIRKDPAITFDTLEKPLVIKGKLMITPDLIKRDDIGPITVEGYRLGTKPASFPGGVAGWQSFLANNLHASVVSEKGGPAGIYKVDLLFSVDEEGNISNIRIMQDPGYGTAEEAVRVMEKSPKWVPGNYNGKPVKLMQRQSIIFSYGAKVPQPI